MHHGKLLAKARKEKRGLKDRAIAEAAVTAGSCLTRNGVLGAETSFFFACDLGKAAEGNALSRAADPSCSFGGAQPFYSIKLKQEAALLRSGMCNAIAPKVRRGAWLGISQAKKFLL